MRVAPTNSIRYTPRRPRRFRTPQALYALLEHCHGRVWEGALTPCTPHSLASASAAAPDEASPVLGTRSAFTGGGGAKDFTWAALSTPTSRSTKPITPSEDAAADVAVIPLHRQPTLTGQPSRREIRRLERRGSWALARQDSTCQCAAVPARKKKKKEEAKAKVRMEGGGGGGVDCASGLYDEPRE